MPELPEVHTTVLGVRKVALGKKISDVWSDFYVGTSHGHKQNIKNKKYFEKLKRTIRGKKIISAERRGKNVVINLNSGESLVIHMKMTGHLMFGKYKKAGNKWLALESGPLQDPFNKFIHFVLTLSDKKHLVLSDMRKFASVTLIKTLDLHRHDHIGTLGIDALDKKLNSKKLEEILLSMPKMPIKSALLNQEKISGIGNIYSDEILWEVGVHPLSEPRALPKNKFKEILEVMRKILNFSIKHGGDSKSDYRNIFGEKGGFQDFHKAYSRRGKHCPKSSCRNKKEAIIKRIVVRGRSSHFCPVHQTLYKK